MTKSEGTRTLWDKTTARNYVLKKKTKKGHRKHSGRLRTDVIIKKKEQETRIIITHGRQDKAEGSRGMEHEAMKG